MVEGSAHMSTKNAAKAEAQAAAVTISYDGVDYLISRDNADDVELYEAAEDGNYITAVRGFLGRAQWEQFKEAHRKDGRVPMAALDGLLDALMAAMGNLSASSTS